MQCLGCIHVGRPRVRDVHQGDTGAEPIQHLSLIHI